MLIITEPIKTVNGLLTLALAARTQLLYSIQRRDYEVTLITGTQVDIAVTTGISVDDTVYVGGIITSVVTVNPTNVIVSDAPSTTGTYLNNISSRQNYRIDIQLIDGTTILFDNTFTYIPNQAGLLNLDVGTIMTTAIITSTGFSKQYLLRVNEVWEGSVDAPVDTTILQAVLASKQLLSVGGANMWENLLRVVGEIEAVPFTRVIISAAIINVDSAGDYVVGQLVRVVSDDGTYNSIGDITTVSTTSIAVNIPYTIDAGPGVTIPIAQAKFLTKFKNPVMWRGWNRTVSLLVDSEFSSRVATNIVRISNRNANINKVDGSSNGTTLQISNPQPNVYIGKVNESTDAYNKVTSTTDGVETISDALYYRQLEPCQNPIMLDWINSKGGIDQWLFEMSQTIQVVSDSGVVAESPINTDIEFISRTKRRFSTSFKQQITMRARKLTTDQVLALQEIKQTESLRVYLSKDGSKFIDGIIITSFTTDYTTGDSLHDFVVVVELPDGFIFEEGRLY